MAKIIEYLRETTKCNMLYRIIFCLVVLVGATTQLQVVWDFDDEWFDGDSKPDFSACIK